MILNAFPNFANDSPNDVDMSPKQADDLVEYQFSLPFPRYLTEASFYVARITDNKTLSQRVHKSLLKAGIIAAGQLSTPRYHSCHWEELLQPALPHRHPCATQAYRHAVLLGGGVHTLGIVGSGGGGDFESNWGGKCRK
jgi:hypothetical protein